MKVSGSPPDGLVLGGKISTQAADRGLRNHRPGRISRSGGAADRDHYGDRRGACQSPVMGIMVISAEENALLPWSDPLGALSLLSQDSTFCCRPSTDHRLRCCSVISARGEVMPVNEAGLLLRHRAAAGAAMAVKIRRAEIAADLSHRRRWVPGRLRLPGPFRLLPMMVVGLIASTVAIPYAGRLEAVGSAHPPCRRRPWAPPSGGTQLRCVPAASY